MDEGQLVAGSQIFDTDIPVETDESTLAQKVEQASISVLGQVKSGDE